MGPKSKLGSWHRRGLLILTLGTIIFAVSMIRVPADIFLADNFNYTNGTLTSAWGSPWEAHSSAGQQPIQVSGGEIRIVGASNAEDVNAPLAGSPYTASGGGILYAGFKVRFTAIPTLAGTYIAHFREPSFIYPCRVVASTTNANSGFFRLGILNGNGTLTASGQIAQDLSLNTVYAVVTRLNVTNGLCTLWLNPTAETDSGVNGADVMLNPATGMDSYAFRQAAGSGTCFVDDLRVGNSFAEVISPNNPPRITGIHDQSILPGTSTTPLAFTVGDLETPASNLVVTAKAANPVLVPDTGFTIAYNGTNHTLIATPAPGKHGTTVITVSVTDGGGTTTITTFRLLVGVPTISCIPSQIILTNTSTGPISFTTDDPAVPIESLTVTAYSSNPTLAPTNRIVLGGSGYSRTVNVSPTPDQSGISTITIEVSDGIAAASSSFTVTARRQIGALVDEPFAYSDGTVLAGGGTPWTSFAGTPGQTKVAGGKVFLSQTNNEGIQRVFPVGTYTPTNGGVLFASFKVSFSQLPTYLGNAFAQFRGGLQCLLYACQRGAPAGGLSLGISQSSRDSSYVALHPVTLALNAEHTVVLRYNVGNQDSTLWIDPVSDLSPSVTAPSGFFAPVATTAFGLQQAASMGTLTVDDLKVGTSFADVLTSADPDTHLTIHPRCDGGVEVVWQGVLTNYTLQHSTNIISGWQEYPNQGVALGDHKVLVLYDPPGQGYFRLHKPMP